MTFRHLRASLVGFATLCAVPHLVGTPSALAQTTTDARDQARARFERAMDLLKANAVDAALAELLESRRLHPTRGNTQNAAVALKRLNRFDEALAMFETLLREFPQMSEEEKRLAAREIEALRERVGNLEVRVVEPGVTLLVDGIERGTTPLTTLVRVNAGNHVLRLFKEGFATVEQKVDVPGAKTTPFQATMVRLVQRGGLRVREANGVVLDVIVDGARVGQTPWTGELAPGEHVVLLRGENARGTQPARATVRLGETADLVLAEETLDTTLRVAPTPIGASVALDGVTLGRGVWEGSVREGEHTIEVAAEGFLPAKIRARTRRDAPTSLTPELERDRSSALWIAKNPARVFLELTGGPRLGSALGGDVASSCSGACKSDLPFGFGGRLRGGYEWSSRLGLALEAGYLRLSSSSSPRATNVFPVGRAAASGTVTDDVSLAGLVAGLSGSFRWGDEWPLTARVGVGAVFGSATDERSGRFQADAPLGDFAFPTTSRSSTATLLYASPEIRFGYRPHKRVEISLGARADVMVLLSAPRFTVTPDVLVTGASVTDRVTFAESKFVSSAVVVASPDAGVRLDF